MQTSWNYGEGTLKIGTLTITRTINYIENNNKKFNLTTKLWCAVSLSVSLDLHLCLLVNFLKYIII